MLFIFVVASEIVHHAIECDAFFMMIALNAYARKSKNWDHDHQSC